jgi:segregation and condensation protein B
MRKRKSSAAPTVETGAVESPVEKDGEGGASAEPSEHESPAVAAEDATGSYASDDVADAPLEGGDGGEEAPPIREGEGAAQAETETEETETTIAAAEASTDAEPEDESAVEAEAASTPAGAMEADGASTGAAGEEASEEASEDASEEASEEPSDLQADADLPPGADDDVVLPTDETRLQSIVESLLFASDRALGVADLKRLLNERDGKRIGAALEALRERRADSGIQLISAAGGWQLRTHPANGAWVAKLVAGRPQRLSRAMMETLAIVAYRQPITRPEIDEIRGVDCGPVLRTLLDRSLVRVIGKKEEVGRPLLYGTTPEFLKTFSLRDLTELPTLRDFHELGAAERAEVDAVTSARGQAGAGGDLDTPLDIGALRPSTVELPNADPDEEEALLEELEQATQVAGRATAATVEPTPAGAEPGEAGVEAAGRDGAGGGER